MTLLFNYTALNGDQGFNTYTVHNVRNVSLLSVQTRRRWRGGGVDIDLLRPALFLCPCVSGSFIFFFSARNWLS